MEREFVRNTTFAYDASMYVSCQLITVKKLKAFSDMKAQKSFNIVLFDVEFEVLSFLYSLLKITQNEYFLTSTCNVKLLFNQKFLIQNDSLQREPNSFRSDFDFFSAQQSGPLLITIPSFLLRKYRSPIDFIWKIVSFRKDKSISCCQVASLKCSKLVENSWEF